MKYFTLFAAAFILAFSAQLPQALAQTSIAVVNVQKLLSESKAAKDVRKQVEKHRETFLAELSKEEEGLRKAQKALTEERASLSQEKLIKKGKAFEEKLFEARREAQKRKRTLDEALARAMNALREEIYKVVASIAEEKSYDLVLSNTSVVLGAKSIDISEETMKRLDKSLSKLPLKLKD